MIIDKELLIIAFVPRSGCELLTDLMRGAKIADLHELYYPYQFSDRIEYYDNIGWGRKIDKSMVSDEKKWFEYVVGSGSVKVGWHSHQVMMQESNELFKLVKKKYIYLRRHDKLRQAISWVIAEQTGQWSHDNENIKECRYDRDAITQRILDIVDQETRWNDYFTSIPHMELFYEDFNTNTVNAIDEYNGLACNDEYSGIQRQSPIEYKIVRDELSEQWVKWYIGN